MPSFPPGANLKGGANAAPVLAQMAREFYEPIIPIAVELRAKGLSLRAIARELEERGVKPRQEFPRWSAAQVRRILLRAAGATTPTCQAPAPDPAEKEVPSIQLWMNGQVRGPFTKTHVKAMLDRREISGATHYHGPGGEWRHVENLFRESAESKGGKQTAASL